MKILTRAKQGEWNVAETVETKVEADLQSLLLESPRLLDISEIRDRSSQLIFAVKEFGLPGSGFTDILAFSSQGDIAIIECKLAANAEIKREVIGQILEYASYLYQMSYETLDKKIKQLKGKSLSELVSALSIEEWDEDLFRQGIVQSLDKGSFILVIVVNEINDRLRRTIRYLNECSTDTAFSIHALEINRFEAEKSDTDKIEILVPHLHGASAKVGSIGTRREQWTEKEFFETFKQKNSGERLSIARNLFDWSSKTASNVWLGTGKEVGSFTFHYHTKTGKIVSLFTVTTGGKLILNYGSLAQQFPTIYQNFKTMVNKIPALEKIPRDSTKWPSVNIDEFKNKNDLDTFKQTILDIKKLVP